MAVASNGSDRRRISARLWAATAVTLAAAALTGAAALAGSGTKAPDKAPNPLAGLVVAGENTHFKQLMEFPNPAGTVGVAYVGEPFDTENHPFFQPGPNGRSCVTCHQPKDAMSLSTQTINALWKETKGQDPVFNPSDGANCPNLPRERRASHSLLLEQGLFRIGLPWPPAPRNGAAIDPEFTIEVVSDPTGCNTNAEYGLKSKNPTISVFRRPRMAGNLRYIDKPGQQYNAKTSLPLERDPETGEHSSMSIMSDARAPSLTAQARDAAGIHMGRTATDEASVHAGFGAFSPEALKQVIDFELKLHVAQNASTLAGRFDLPNTPKALGVAAMVKGEAGRIGNDRDTGVFFFFEEWRGPGKRGNRTDEFRASVARGYDLFFFQPFWIRDTFGINSLPLGNPYKQTCAFCHSTQLTGGDVVPGWMDIGANNRPHALPAMDSKLPTFKVTCKPSALPHPYLGRVIYTHDPGRGLISGRCRDVGALVMQQFRGIAARAPYFSNGSAKDLRAIIDFYNTRYDIKYTERNKQDLVNFFSVL